MPLMILASAACSSAEGPAAADPPESSSSVDPRPPSADDGCDTATWYEDADGDGVGADDTRVDDCDAPIGYVAEGADCDDADPDVHAATSVDRCENGKDENCDGVDSDCRELGEEDVVARLTQIECGNILSPGGGEALVAIDGALLAGHGHGCGVVDGVTWNMGVVYVWRGPVAGEHRLDESPQVILPPEPFRTEDHESFGWSLAAVGDAGLVVGTYAPYVFYYDDFLAADPRWTWTEPQPAMDVGGVIGSGDLDADGLPEIAFDGSWYMGGYSQPLGVVRIISGTAAGDLGDGDQVADITDGRGYLGYDLDIIGDADGDGFDDLVVSSLSPIFIYRGPVRGVLGRAEADAWLDDPDAHFGFVTRAGDQDGDGLGDVLVSNRYSAAVSATHDGEIAASEYDATLRCDLDGGVGTSVYPSGVGDTNGDGWDELFLERSDHANWIAFGPVVGALDCLTDGQRLEVGRSVSPHAALVDLNGDPSPELAVLAGDLGAVAIVSGLGAGL